MDFFKYKKAVVNFIYSFTWDISEVDFTALCPQEEANDGWELLKLYKRKVRWMSESNQGSYQPNLLSQNLLVLHKSGIVDSRSEILIPIRREKKVIENSIFSELTYDIRIYENGSGNCTFSFILQENPTFEQIQFVLHLASSISFFEEDMNSLKNTAQHLTHTYLKCNHSASDLYPQKSKRVSLIDLFTQLLQSNILPPIWRSKNLWYDPKVISSTKGQFDSWQTPYVLTAIEVDEAQFREFEDGQEPSRIKEVGAIACRFSLDNSQIVQDYEKLKREYVFGTYGHIVVPKDEKDRDGARLKNYSHHSDLFYTFGKRGAIAITPSFEMNPSYFVVPTLLNLIEILRSRWHLGSLVNLKLDDTLEHLTHTKDFVKLLDEIFEARILFGLFYKDPAPYLFDGGAITEIAEAGSELFWLDKLSKEMQIKFAALDKLVDEMYYRKRIEGSL